MNWIEGEVVCQWCGSHPYGRSRRAIGALVRLVLLVCFVSLSAYTVANLIAGRRLEHEITRLRGQGEPVTLREVAPPPVPDVENAALVYEQAFRRLPGREAARPAGAGNSARLSNADDLVLRAFLSEDPAKRRRVTIDQVRSILSGTDAALVFARRAAAMPRCRFPVNWEAGAGALFPHYPRLLALASLLAAHAVLAAEDGRPADAPADIEALVGMSRHIGDEAILIGQLVQYRCLTMATNALERVLEVGETFGGDDGQRLCRELGAIDLHDLFVRALKTERCLGLWAFGVVRVDARPLMSEEEPQAILRLVTAVQPVGEPLLKLDEITYLKYMERLVRRAEERRAFQPTEVSEIDAFPWYAVVSRVLVPATWKVTRKRDDALARVALARWGLALQQFHRTSGRYPESLDEARPFLAGELPLDPFTYRPLIYGRRGAGYLLYSVGANRLDDGGENRRDKVHRTDPLADEAPDDIAWRIGG